ncbi:MAG TPA: polynucleotide adenylyltransferase PcnB [Candidatus Limnocylindrales bacterium]|nr:polynucleotide adenylyltransferase PcnB [Candidatus Limnocylindrales bacterium]
MEPRILARAEHPISRRDIDANVLKVLYRLAGAGYDAYLVGGGVRDLMLSRRPKDFDVATSAHPQQVRDLFRNSRMIGRRFRLVHVFFGRQNVEVATFRKQAEAVADTDDPLIRLDNTFGTPEEDAFRRDFTVNALFYSPQSFNVIDFPGGVDDLEARLIRTIGDPELRMREDPVRMMRAVRFAAKLGFEIEPATRAAIGRHRADLDKASVPRLVDETYKTLGQPEAAHALVLMEELGLLEHVIPILASHLKSRGTTLAEQPAVRNMAALGRAIGSGLSPDHSIVLAALMLDLYRDEHRQPTARGGTRGRSGGDNTGHRIDILGELRARGFARGDTEQMRLLLEAFENLAAPTRRTRRLMRRPYFPDARMFFEMSAPTYSIDATRTMHYLADPDSFTASPTASRVGADAPAAPDGAAPPAPNRRRRRRRRRRPRHGGAANNGVPSGDLNGVSVSDPPPDHTRRD